MVLKVALFIHSISDVDISLSLSITDSCSVVLSALMLVLAWLMLTRLTSCPSMSQSADWMFSWSWVGPPNSTSITSCVFSTSVACVLSWAASSSLSRFLGLAVTLVVLALISSGVLLSSSFYPPTLLPSSSYLSL